MFNAWNTCTVGEIASPVKNALVGGPFGSHLVSADYIEKYLMSTLNEQFAESAQLEQVIRESLREVGYGT